MSQLAHKTAPQNHTKHIWFYPSPFTGKERDEETGYGYFGARYMDFELTTMWLSVDPMADKYPNISPYAYCAWNPIMAIDPSGMDSVHTPNGMVNVGEGYKATPDGHYLYGDGLQPKRWNPDLEVGSVVGNGLRGGYENCDDGELPVLDSYDLCGTAKNAAFAIDAFTAPQSTLIEYLAADNPQNVTKSLGKSVGRYTSGIKMLGYAGTVTTIGASVIQGYDYYSNGGTSLLIGAKLTLDVIMARVSNFGPIGMAAGFTYSLLDVCTGGFGTNNEINKYIK